MSEKVKEANECYKQAEQYLKSGLFKRPDYDSAANEYSRAATCFKAAKLQDKSLDAQLKAADCYTKNRSYYSAAKCCEQVAMISKELNDWDNVIKYYEKACHLYREHGVPDTAALTINRGAQMIEAKYPEKAAEWYCQASEVTMLEDRPRQAAEYSNKAVRLFLKLKRYDDAVTWLRNAINHLQEVEDFQACGRLVVSIVLVQLAKDDFVAAQKAFQDGKQFVEQQEIYTLNRLLEGYDQLDSEAIYEALNSPFIKNLDNEFAKLARALQQSHAVAIESKGQNQTIPENEEEPSML